MSKTFDRPNTVYGSDDTRQRCARWAEAGSFKLVRRIRFCSHILRRKACGRLSFECMQRPDTFDHGRVWERVNGTRFLLAHEYVDLDSASEVQELLARAREAAQRRGMVVCVDWSMNWYFPSRTVPLRFDVMERS